MAVTIRVAPYPTGRTDLAATLERLDNGKFWNETDGEWQVLPFDTAEAWVDLTESASPSLQEYTGSPGDLGSPGKVRIRVHEKVLGMVVGMVETDVYANAEVAPAVTAGGLVRAQVDSVGTSAVVDLGTVTDAVEAALAGYFADIPGDVDAELTIQHGDGNWVSILGSGADAVAITLSSDGLGVPGFAVWITSDAGGTLVEAGRLATDDEGRVGTMLSNGGTYWLWANAPAGYNDLVGVEFEASAAEGNEFEVSEITTPELGASVYDLLPQVRPYLAKCEEPLMKTALRESARKFFQETEIWHETQETTLVKTLGEPPVAGTQVAGARIALVSEYAALTRRVLSVMMDDGDVSDTEYTVTDVAGVEVLEFEEERDADTEWEIEKVLWPKPSCYEYPALLLERWGYAIAAGAKASLSALAEEPWSNSRNAATFYSEYRNGVADAKGDTMTEKKAGARELVLPKVF